MSLLGDIKKNIYVQGDFVVFGYGGFTTVPRGWGMDICYLHRRDFKGFGAAKRIREKIRKAEAKYAKDGFLTELFLPNFMRQMYQIGHYEWHYEKSRLMFEYCRASMPGFKRYDDFRQFLAECMGGNYGMSPIDLEKLIRQRIAAMAGKVDFDEILRNQRRYLIRHAQDVMKRVFHDVFGYRDGDLMLKEVLDAHNGNVTLDPDDEDSIFRSEKFVAIVSRHHAARMKLVLSDAFLESELKTMKVELNPDKRIGKARRDTVRGLKQQHQELLMLARAMEIPMFIAVDGSANFFRHFFGGISMYVAKDKEELQEYVVLGLCMYQPAGLGGIIVTHGGRNYPRFWHTLTEELTHFADGPSNRMTMAGHHRYSASKAFMEAIDEDKATIAPWGRGGVLGAKEWAQALTLKKVNPFTAARVKKRVEAFEATLDFDHYRPEERAAEIFAALPIIERAVGAGKARRIMPRMFSFYDQVYLPGLKKEAAEQA